MPKIKLKFYYLRFAFWPTVRSQCVDVGNVGNAIQLFSFPLHMRLYALQLHIACCKRPAILSSPPIPLLYAFFSLSSFISPSACTTCMCV